jgi:hypothetical protein
MRKLKTAVFMFISTCGIVRGGPLILSFVPFTQSTSPGSLVSTDVVISGVTRPPSVGAFDVEVGFNPAVLSSPQVSFTNFLGDPDLLEVLTSTSLMPGELEFAAVSLLSPPQLDTLQLGSFRLATISFAATGLGTSPLGFSQVIIDDAFGISLPVTALAGSISDVPEASTAYLFVIAFLGVLACQRIVSSSESSPRISAPR